MAGAAGGTRRLAGRGRSVYGRYARSQSGNSGGSARFDRAAFASASSSVWLERGLALLWPKRSRSGCGNYWGRGRSVDRRNGPRLRRWRIATGSEAQTRLRLEQASKRLVDLLQRQGLSVAGGAGLISVASPVGSGVLAGRLGATGDSGAPLYRSAGFALRLPGAEPHWRRLELALAGVRAERLC